MAKMFTPSVSRVSCSTKVCVCAHICGIDWCTDSSWPSRQSSQFYMWKHEMSTRKKLANSFTDCSAHYHETWLAYHVSFWMRAWLLQVWMWPCGHFTQSHTANTQTSTMWKAGGGDTGGELGKLFYTEDKTWPTWISTCVTVKTIMQRLLSQIEKKTPLFFSIVFYIMHTFPANSVWTHMTQYRCWTAITVPLMIIFIIFSFYCVRPKRSGVIRRIILSDFWKLL